MKHGTSTIDHNIRCKLKLNCLEYAVADYIATHKIQNVLDPCAKFLGISIEQANKLYQSLIDKYLMMNNGVGCDFECTDKWKDEFKAEKTEDKIEEKTEELWKLHRYGNKPTCKKRLPKVLKKLSFEELKDKLIKYLKACDSSDTSKKMLSTWLDPEKEYWQDPLPVAKPKFGQQPQIAAPIIKYSIK